MVKARLQSFLSVSLLKGIYCLVVVFIYGCLRLLVLAGVQPGLCTLLDCYLNYYSSTVEELYCTWYQSGFFSLINVGSGFHCLRSFSFLFSFVQHTKKTVLSTKAWVWMAPSIIHIEALKPIHSVFILKSPGSCL